MCNMSDLVPIEPAATLILVRDSHEGPQVLMQQRNPNAVFVGGAWVFPGGKVDAEDSHPCWQQLAECLDEESACQILDLENQSSPYNLDQIHPDEANTNHQANALAYWVAALREAFEEAGLLLVKQSIHNEQREQWREQLLNQRLSWRQIIADNGLTLDLSSLRYLSRWVTPPNNPRRYDTRFFITKAPEEQEPTHEDYEAIQTCWITPKDALSAYQNKKMKLIFPTIMTLKAMLNGNQTFASTDELIENVIAHFNS